MKFLFCRKSFNFLKFSASFQLFHSRRLFLLGRQFGSSNDGHAMLAHIPCTNQNHCIPSTCTDSHEFPCYKHHSKHLRGVHDSIPVSIQLIQPMKQLGSLELERSSEQTLWQHFAFGLYFEWSNCWGRIGPKWWYYHHQRLQNKKMGKKINQNICLNKSIKATLYLTTKLKQNIWWNLKISSFKTAIFTFVVKS